MGYLSQQTGGNMPVGTRVIEKGGMQVPGKTLTGGCGEATGGMVAPDFSSRPIL